MHTVCFVVAIVVMACEGEPIGRVCDLGDPTPARDEVVVASPALDCVSRTCLRVPPPDGVEDPSENTGLCTATCETDDDCESVPDSPCTSGFTCGIPPGQTVGAFCCQKLCVCRDYVAGGVLVPPKACDANNPANTCQNLPGR